MKRTIYKGYVIDYDNLGRLYVYNLASAYSEDSDSQLVTNYYSNSPKRMTDLQAAKMAIDNYLKPD